MITRIKTKIVFVLFLIAMLTAGCSVGLIGSGDSGDANGSGGTVGSGGSDIISDSDNGVANGGQPGAADTLTGATDKILESVVDEAKAALSGADEAAATLSGADELPPTVMEPITLENAPVMLGLIPDDFVEFVEEATVVQSMLDPHAFQAALVKCKDAESAQIINEQIKSGFDSGKWISILPEQSLTVVSGSYILLAVGNIAQTEALAEAFRALAGANVSEPEIFYDGETGSGNSGSVDF